MKKIFILLLITLSFGICMKINAEILYPDLQATVEGIDLNKNDPYLETKIKLSVDNENLQENSYKVLYAKSTSALEDSFKSNSISSNDNILMDSIYTKEEGSKFNNYLNFNCYKRFGALSGDTYIAIYKFETSNYNYVKISSTLKLNRPDKLPLSKRIDAFFIENISMYIYEFDYNTSSGINKTLSVKVGKVSNNTLLKKLKNGNGINDLLNYAKADTNPLYTKTVQYETSARYTNDINKNLLVDKNYYYVYITRDSENGKYEELEDVNLYQYYHDVSGDYAFLYPMRDSRFVWNLEESDPETINFGSSSFTCNVGEQLSTMINISNGDGSAVASYESNDSSVATIEQSEIQTNCINCKSVVINCLSAGTATLTATTSNGVTGSAKVTVVGEKPAIIETIIDAPVGTMHTLTYNSNGGSTCNPRSKKALMETSWGDLCAPARKGYQFAGWFTSKNGGEQITSDTIATENLTVYAQWVGNPKTGISTPTLALMILALISTFAFLVVRNKNMSFN